MKTVKLITCNDAMKAHILQGALENEGIESILHNENFSTLYKSCVSNIAGVDILVADEDYENALMVTPPGDNHWNYTCKQCHKTFEMPVSKFNPSAETEE